ncbi:hypothetical protein UG55_100680 [Frankia sp. EI5c]|nr:hypothetical protein UG55_100680 [Frankia sp. EI5c]
MSAGTAKGRLNVKPGESVRRTRDGWLRNAAGPGPEPFRSRAAVGVPRRLGYRLGDLSQASQPGRK